LSARALLRPGRARGVHRALRVPEAAPGNRARAGEGAGWSGRMLSVLARRILWAVPSALVITALLFFSVAGLLGSPAAMMLGQDATPQSIAELNARLGFDRPLSVQYLEWMGRALIGDFGRSFSTHETVAAAILPRL